jgi:phosphoribosylformylglycinamidine synthase
MPPPDLDPSQVVLRYAVECNGSVDDIAGVCNAAGTVMGLMPHPEHAVDPLLGSADGALMFASLVEAARGRALAAA